MHLVALGHLKIAGSEAGLPSHRSEKKHLQPCMKELQACRKPYPSSETQKRCNMGSLLVCFVVWSLECRNKTVCSLLKCRKKTLCEAFDSSWDLRVMHHDFSSSGVLRHGDKYIFVPASSLYSTICNSRLVSWCDVSKRAHM